MQKEFMLYVRNAANAKADLTEAAHLEFIRKCELYIVQLKAEDHLIAAQPLIREGLIISRKNQIWQGMAIDISKDVQVGYYHIKAKDMDEAVSIAKANPEFEYVPSASVEIRPIKIMEEETRFVYPT